MSTVLFSRVSYYRLNLSAYASVQVLPLFPAFPRRANTTVVQNPRAMFVRNDGKVTIQGANKSNTVTVDLTGRLIILTDYFGITTEADFFPPGS